MTGFNLFLAISHLFGHTGTVVVLSRLLPHDNGQIVSGWLVPARHSVHAS